MMVKHRQSKVFFLSLANGMGNASMCVLFIIQTFRNNPTCQHPYLIVADKN